MTAEELARPEVQAIIAELREKVEARGGKFPEIIPQDWPLPPPVIDRGQKLLVKPKPVERCRHLGRVVVGLRQCSTCRGNVRFKEFACAVGLGDRGRAVPSIDCGPRCSGYLPEKEGVEDAATQDEAGRFG